MAESKRYYWLKLKDDYFTSPKIRKLRKIAGGDTLTIIYLKMQLLTVKSGGTYEFQGIENSFEEELALMIDEDLDNVKLTLAFLQAQNLVFFDEESNKLVLYEAMANVGSECESAERVRLCREREKTRKSLQCNESVTGVKRLSYISNISNSNSFSNEIKEIIEYLNSKINARYKATTNSTQTHIKARLKEGFTVADFKTVIDKKAGQWLGNSEFQQYLRPETLFCAKHFESYLNEVVSEKKTTVAPKRSELYYMQHDYTAEQLNGLFKKFE